MAEDSAPDVNIASRMREEVIAYMQQLGMIRLHVALACIEIDTSHGPRFCHGCLPWSLFAGLLLIFCCTLGLAGLAAWHCIPNQCSPELQLLCFITPISTAIL